MRAAPRHLHPPKPPRRRVRPWVWVGYDPVDPTLFQQQAATLALLDLLDEYMDVIRDHVLDPSAHVALGDAYWQVRHRVDALRDELAPKHIYPECTPVENCPHPGERAYAFIYTDLEDGNDYVIACCCSCGRADQPAPLGAFGRKKSKRKKKGVKA